MTLTDIIAYHEEEIRHLRSALEGWRFAVQAGVDLDPPDHWEKIAWHQEVINFLNCKH